MSLHGYQLQMVEHIARHPRTNLFVPMGAGKTLAVLTALDSLSVSEDVFPALVIAPLRVARSTWPGEIRKWPHLKHLKVSVVVGNPRERVLALQAPADIFVVNYDNLPWLIEQAGATWRFKTVVADECTRLKGLRANQGSKRAGALAKVAFKSSRYIGLTGTPASNGLKDLWGVNWFLDRGERLGKSYSAFMNRWFENTAPAWSNFPVFEPREIADREIHEKIADITVSIDLKDHLDIKEPIRNVVEVELPPAARKAYNTMWRELVAELKKGTVVAANAAVKTGKCLQIANGAIYTDSDWDEVHKAKLEALDSILEEASGMPVLVAYNFKHDLLRLQKAFPQGRVLDADPKTIDAWNAGKIPLLFAHPASAGHGLNLQDGGNILAFFGLDWNLENHLQIIERIGPTRQAQAGHDRPVFIYYIVAKDTVDELVLERLKGKKNVVDILMEAVKQ